MRCESKSEDVQVCVDDATLGHLNSTTFRQKWEALYERCPWATICQSPAFVTAWYEVYQAKYRPVIAFAFSIGGDLKGLLTLAISKDGNSLIAAGGNNAEYHCWLEDPTEEPKFIPQALPRIFAAFPHHDLFLKYLPSMTPLEWFASREKKDIFYSIRPHQRPLMKTDDANVAHQMRRKSTKRKLNSLKRCGDVEFDVIVDHDRFVEVFHEICRQCDQRQKIAREVTPFANDPLLKEFYVALHRRGLLHTTVLKVNGKLAASHTGVLCKHSLQLNFITHAPELAHHSPGAVHIAMLAVQLNKEAIPIFDLTPGGDAYKELFATDHDTVFELNLYRNWHSYYKNELLFHLRNMAKSVFIRVGVNPTKLRILFRRLAPSNP